MSSKISQALESIKQGDGKELVLYGKTLTDEDLEPLTNALVGSKIETLEYATFSFLYTKLTLCYSLDNNLVCNVASLAKVLPLSNITTLQYVFAFSSIQANIQQSLREPNQEPNRIGEVITKLQTSSVEHWQQ